MLTLISRKKCALCHIRHFASTSKALYSAKPQDSSVALPLITITPQQPFQCPRSMLGKTQRVYTRRIPGVRIPKRNLKDDTLPEFLLPPAAPLSNLPTKRNEGQIEPIRAAQSLAIRTNRKTSDLLKTLTLHSGSPPRPKSFYTASIGPLPGSPNMIRTSLAPPKTCRILPNSLISSFHSSSRLSLPGSPKSLAFTVSRSGNQDPTKPSSIPSTESSDEPPENDSGDDFIESKVSESSTALGETIQSTSETANASSTTEENADLSEEGTSQHTPPDMQYLELRRWLTGEGLPAELTPDRTPEEEDRILELLDFLRANPPKPPNTNAGTTVPPTSGQTDGAEESREAKEELNPLAEDVSTPTEISIERPRELPHRPALLKGVETLSNISLRLSPDQWSSLIEVASLPSPLLSSFLAFAKQILSHTAISKVRPIPHEFQVQYQPILERGRAVWHIAILRCSEIECKRLLRAMGLHRRLVKFWYRTGMTRLSEYQRARAATLTKELLPPPKAKVSVPDATSPAESAKEVVPGWGVDLAPGLAPPSQQSTTAGPPSFPESAPKISDQQWLYNDPSILLRSTVDPKSSWSTKKPDVDALVATPISQISVRDLKKAFKMVTAETYMIFHGSELKQSLIQYLKELSRIETEITRGSGPPPSVRFLNDPVLRDVPDFSPGGRYTLLPSQTSHSKSGLSETSQETDLGQLLAAVDALLLTPSKPTHANLLKPALIKIKSELKKHYHSGDVRTVLEEYLEKLELVNKERVEIKSAVMEEDEQIWSKPKTFQAIPRMPESWPVEKKLSQIQAILIKTSYQTYIPHLYRAFVAVTSELLKDGHSDSIRTELRQRLEELRKLESNVLQSWMTEAETTRRNISIASYANNHWTQEFANVVAFSSRPIDEISVIDLYGAFSAVLFEFKRNVHSLATRTVILEVLQKLRAMEQKLLESGSARQQRRADWESREDFIYAKIDALVSTPIEKLDSKALYSAISAVAAELGNPELPKDARMKLERCFETLRDVERELHVDIGELKEADITPSKSAAVQDTKLKTSQVRIERPNPIEPTLDRKPLLAQSETNISSTPYSRSLLRRSVQDITSIIRRRQLSPQRLRSLLLRRTMLMRTQSLLERIDLLLAQPIRDIKDIVLDRAFNRLTSDIKSKYTVEETRGLLYLYRDKLREVEAKKVDQEVADIGSDVVEPSNGQEFSLVRGWLSPDELQWDPIPRTPDDPPVATLHHGLDRVLFNPAPHMLQDPHSHVYNFPPSLQSLPTIGSFAFDRLSGFVKSSQDQDLGKLARSSGRKFTGSTSSLTSLLSHIYFLVSAGREVDTSTLSAAFASEPRTFTPGLRMPATVVLRFKDGIYATDSDDTWNLDRNESKDILMYMGTMLEKLLTLPEEAFQALSVDSPAENVPPPKPEAYQYVKTSNYVMRSQLDCYDPRLPGSGIFDIKTRAAAAIRLDRLNHEANSGYLLKTLTGAWESYEREYYDLIRSAFLKYSFQARIGCMDGIFLAYHNTARMFGFQYVPLREMDQRLFGGPVGGQRAFNMCVAFLERLMEEIVKCRPEETTTITLETNRSSSLMRVWIEPQEWDVDKNGSRPVAQLDVTVNNMINDANVDGPPPFEEDGSSWSLQYNIRRSSPSAETRASLDRARALQDKIRAVILPEGVSRISVSEHWVDGEELKRDSGGDSPETSSIVNNSIRGFRRTKSPSPYVQHLRQLAKAGREETRKLAKMTEGKERVVWEPKS